MRLWPIPIALALAGCSLLIEPNPDFRAPPELADTYSDRDEPDRAFGDEPVLRVDASRQAYIALPDLELDLDLDLDLDEIEWAALILTCTKPGGRVELYGVEQPWTEATLTWANAPELVGEPFASFVATPGEHVIELSDALREWLAGGPDRSLGLRLATGDGEGEGATIEFSSSEGEAGPYLLLILGV